MDTMASNWRYYEKKMNEEFEKGNKEQALKYKDTYIELYKAKKVNDVVGDLKDRISSLEKSIKDDTGTYKEVEANKEDIHKMSKKIKRIDKSIKSISDSVDYNSSEISEIRDYCNKQSILKKIWNNIKPAYFAK